MKRHSQNTQTIVLIFMVSLLAIGCSKDEMANNPERVLPYDASKHIYATFGDIDIALKWEVVIDPLTGRFDRIEETETIFGGITGRLGARQLTSFNRNERIFIPTADDTKIVVQDLTSFAKTEIALTDTLIDKTMIFPEMVKFGSSQNEVYILDSDKSIWNVNFDQQATQRIHDRIPVINNTTISNFFYLEATGHFLCSTNNNAINDYWGDDLLIFNPEATGSDAIISSISIARGIGFVQHPLEKNHFYYIQAPIDDMGFRLMRVELEGAMINIVPVSNQDLAIDNLSLYLQSIHTAQNIYIIKGGNGSIETPSNIIYSIDLDSGELINAVGLEETGILLKIAAE